MREMEVASRKSLEVAEESSINDNLVLTLRKKNAELEKKVDTQQTTIAKLEERVEEEGRISAISTAALRADLDLKLEEIKVSDTQLKGAIHEVEDLRKELAEMSTELKCKSDEAEQLTNVDDVHNAAQISATTATLVTLEASDSQILVLCNDIKTMKDQLQRTAGKYISKIRSQKAQVSLRVVSYCFECVMNVCTYTLVLWVTEELQ